MNERQKELFSVAGLFLAALLWGVSYPATKIVENYPTFYIISIRFTVAALALAIIFFKRFKKINKDVVKYAFLLSFCITSMYILSTIGIKYTISARASFFTCLTFIIVPILNYFMYKVKISNIILRSILICFAGVFLLSYTPGIGSFKLNLGDVLCIFASLAGSFHIAFLERVTKKDHIDPMLFTTLLMAFVAVWGTFAAIFTGSFKNVEITEFHFGTIIFLGLLCSAAAFLLQSVCQRYVASNRTGVILAMEPASGCILSVIVLNETMGISGAAGAALVLASSIYMEVAANMRRHGDEQGVLPE